MLICQLNWADIANLERYDAHQWARSLQGPNKSIRRSSVNFRSCYGLFVPIALMLCSHLALAESPAPTHEVLAGPQRGRTPERCGVNGPADGERRSSGYRLKEVSRQRKASEDRITGAAYAS
jgi:hypothetical protein